MKRLAALLVLAALSVALGDEKKSRLYAPDPWKEGETTTETGLFRQIGRPNVLVGQSDPRQKVTSLEYALVRRCLAVDAAGRWTRGEAAITKWVRTGGPAEDRSIEGAVVSLETGGAWKIVSGGDAATSDAKQWLAATFAQKDAMGGDGAGTAPDDAPKDEIAVGATTSVRMTSFEQGYARLGLPVPPEGIFAKYVLHSVEPSADGTKIEFVQTIDASLQGPGKNGDKDVAYLEGSEVHQRIVCKKVLGRAHAVFSLKVENDFTLVMPSPKGPMSNTTSVLQTLDRVAGGEMPAAK
jgi:hypothetical protein